MIARAKESTGWQGKGRDRCTGLVEKEKSRERLDRDKHHLVDRPW